MPLVWHILHGWVNKYNMKQGYQKIVWRPISEFQKENNIFWKFIIALSYDTLIKKMSHRWQKSFAVKWCLYFNVFLKTNLCAFGACPRPKQTRQKSSWMANRQQNGVVNRNDPGAFIKLLTWYMTFLKNRSLYFNS